jgi:small GTP-binding protein
MGKYVKVVTIGNSGTGKTSIIRYYCFNETATPNEPTTIGVESRCTATVPIGAIEWEVHFFDTAGTEQYRALIPSYLRDATSVLLVFDYGSVSSFEAVDQWVAYIEDACLSRPLIYLVGNKVDLPEKAVSEDDFLHCLSRSPGIKSGFQTSAVTGQGINHLMTAVLTDASALALVQPVSVAMQDPPESEGCC